ncbi:MAG TPA: adenylate/guanylate cyclase domain-containing protein [Candidatus Eisenbacteria bacterium]|nr:adenylate/guanylate cyclase domain-containing protein [Candidatus Eisenbacteria bacterium]
MTPEVSRTRTLADSFESAWDALVLGAVRAIVDAVRYQPQHTALVLACGASQPEVPQPVVRWWADVRVSPTFLELSGLPHALVRRIAAVADHWLGPTGSAVVRWLSGATAAATDRVTAHPIERSLRARAHPGLLVPHPHDAAVVAVDMRGFSNLTRELSDTQYLSELIGEYLTELTRVIERHGGVVFQYTGDGLLAVFLPELAGLTPAALLDMTVHQVCPALHQSFDALYERWQSDWKRERRAAVRIGLGVGLSFGAATIGFIGPAGKKQIGVIGEPVNVAAYLCSQARAGSALVDRASFARAGAEPPQAKVARLRSKKPHQRIETICLYFRGGRQPTAVERLRERVSLHPRPI